MLTNDNNIKVSIDFNKAILDHLLVSLLSDNQNISKKYYFKVRELMEITDMMDYDNDREMQVRFHLINQILEARLDYNLDNVDLIMSHQIDGGQFHEEAKEVFNELSHMSEISNEDYYFIDQYVSERVKYAYIFSYEETLENLVYELKTRSFDTLEEFNDKFSNTMESVYRSIKKVKSKTKESELDFSTGNEQEFYQVISTTIAELNDPGNIVRTGVKYLNQMLNGGFHAGRVYLFIAPSKSWKSGILLNSALWALKYNSGLQPRDKTKKPAVVYMTQENGITETITRLWSHFFGNNSKINDYEPKEAIDMLMSHIENTTGIQLIIKYRNNRSISTTDLDLMIDEIAVEDNAEVVMLIHDYVKRIRSAEHHTELRLELGAIINEFTVIAKSRKIPVLSATQLNRDAFRKIENSAKNSAIEQLGVSDVGESIDVIQNADYSIAMSKDYVKSTDQTFISFKLLTGRGLPPEITMFSHPMPEGNTMALVEDVLMDKPQSVLDINDSLSEFNPNTGGTDPGINNPKNNRTPSQSRGDIDNIIKITNNASSNNEATKESVETSKEQSDESSNDGDKTITAKDFF